MKSTEEIKKGIDELEKLRALMTFDPSTGEDIDPFFLNEENRQLYEGVGIVLQYIQQFEAQNAELLKKVEQLQAERDAAVGDINMARPCRICKNIEIDQVCAQCSVGGRNFEWRGVQKEDGNAKSS